MITIAKITDYWFFDGYDIRLNDMIMECDNLSDVMKLDWLKENINNVTLEQLESLIK